MSLVKTSSNSRHYADTDLRRDLLSVTAFFSVLLHTILILGVSFTLPEIGSRANTDNTLDVVLLSSTNDIKNEEAELVSSNDNEGGGDDDRIGETPLPWKAVDPSPINSFEKIADSAKENTLAPDKYVTSNSSTVSLQRDKPEETELKNSDNARGPDAVNTEARRLERERLIARLTQSQEEYRKRPKKTFHSPSTKANGAAEYLESWRKKVVRVGNAKFPTRIRANNLHGTLTLSIEIRRDGMIHEITILNPSEHKILNDSALRIIRDAAPFDAFPDEEYFENTDILVITRAIHFLPSNRIASSSGSRG